MYFSHVSKSSTFIFSKEFQNSYAVAEIKVWLKDKIILCKVIFSFSVCFGILTEWKLQTIHVVLNSFSEFKRMGKS